MRETNTNHDDLINRLRVAVGSRFVVTAAASSHAFRTGYRMGGGEAVAVVRPCSLSELWHVAQVSIECGAIVIMQAANTGLTGGSTPFGDYDRPVIVINTLRIRGVIPALNGRQAICLAGATLTDLQAELRQFNRTPHSVTGSSCLGASVIGGICNNSGGALVGRGPAFTRYSLFARVSEGGTLELVNNLGVKAADPVQLLAKLDRGAICGDDLEPDDGQAGLCDYEEHVRSVDQPTPARFNADPRSHFESSGSAGKIIVFAVRVDSFPAPKVTTTFCLSTDDAAQFAQIRRDILSEFPQLPISAEYIHRDAARLAASHGNDVCTAVRLLGERGMPQIFRLKRAFDGLWRRLTGRPGAPSERLLQALGSVLRHPLPKTLRTMVESHEHTLLLTVADDAILKTETYLAEFSGARPAMVRCSPAEASALQRLRFAAAGAVVRFAAVESRSGALVAMDCALPRNLAEWDLKLPLHLSNKILLEIRYGHFMCHVFHLDFILKLGVNVARFEGEMQHLLQKLGAQCPAEHNFGHHYAVPEHLAAFYRFLDPSNSLNPGIGKTSRLKNWA